MSTAEGDITALEQTDTEIKASVTKAQGDISSLQLTADSIATRVSTAEGNISTLTQTANSIATRVSTAEGDITALEQTDTEIKASVTKAQGDISSLQLTADSIATRVSTAEGNISTLTQTVNGITMEVSDASGNSATLMLKSGDTVLTSAKITMVGMVTFADLSTEGSTTISGSNITSGTINANNVTISGNLSSATISASKITAGESDADITFGGSFTAPSATITGTITATTLYADDSGSIAGWTINSSSLTKGTRGTDNFLGIYSSYSAGSTTVGGVTSDNWRIIGGTKFGVTRDGTLAASDAVISGTIHATDGSFSGDISGSTGKIGQWNIGTRHGYTGLYSDQATDGTTQNTIMLSAKYGIGIYSGGWSWVSWRKLQAATL